jgi:hypothetical protein
MYVIGPIKVFALLALSFCSAFAQPASQNTISQSNIDRNFFIENKGQWHSDVLFLARLDGMDAWITKYGLNFSFYKAQVAKAKNETCNNLSPEQQQKGRLFEGQRVLMRLENGNEQANASGNNKLSGYHNYFIGNDSTKHFSHVGLYKDVFVHDVYPGISMHYYFDNGKLRYDYIVQPHADPNLISFSFKGDNEACLNEDGHIAISTRFGEVRLADLLVYQGKEKRRIESGFTKNKDYWHISVGSYNKDEALVIDPVVFSTNVGGSGADLGFGIAIDNLGNSYVCGETSSINYDTTAGTFQTSNAGDDDVVITKLNHLGNALIFSTYLGGTGYEGAYGGIALDAFGNIYVAGTTTSSDFPVTTGAYQMQTSIADGVDVFVTKVNPTGTALIYSTYLGGSEDELCTKMVVDKAGNAYVTGLTPSIDFDTTAGAYQTTSSSGLSGDGFVTKLNSAGTGLIFSTYLGGNDLDYCSSIAIDSFGSAYVTGHTVSSNFPTTLGAYQTSASTPLADAFIAKLNPLGSAVIYSTLIGGSDVEYSDDIAVDKFGNAYITGSTKSSDFDTTFGAYNTNYQGSTDVYVTKLNSLGSQLVYSTFIGGNGNELGNNIVVAPDGICYIAGTANSPDFPITADAVQTQYDYQSDLFICLLDSAGANLLYSTYLGGNGTDIPGGIASDSFGNIYVQGSTNAFDFLNTPGSYQGPVTNGVFDMFVTKLKITNALANNPQLQLPKWTIYPNPTSDYFILSTQVDADFELVDYAGKVINTYRVVKGAKQSVSHIPTGVYLLREIGTGTSQKLVVK